MRLQRGATANANPLIVLILGLAVFSNGIPLARAANRNSSKADRPAPMSEANPAAKRPATESNKRDPSRKSPDSKAIARVNENYGRVPMSFEANHGQADSKIEFFSRGRGYGLF